MIKEGIHDNLADIYYEFDRHSRVTNTKYSIDADYYDMQGYRIMDCPNFQGFLRHITNYVKNHDVDMEVNGSRVNYDDLSNPTFKLEQLEQPIFKFTVSAIQENNLFEMQLKSPTTVHTVKQAPFRASFRKNKPGFRYEGNPKKKKRKKGKKVDEESFCDKLDAILAENIMAFSEPEVLFTQDAHAQPDNALSSLVGAKDYLTSALDQYHFALKSTSDLDQIDHLNSAIENCTDQINRIEIMLDN